MIKVSQLSKAYLTPSGSKTVLESVSFEVPSGSFTTIFGPNGCGKTTILNILAGLDTDYRGEIEGLEEIRTRIGFVFQDYRRSLLPWKSVKDNILFPLDLQRISRAVKEQRLAELLQKVPVPLDLAQPVFSLSGGQAQLVGILRALIINPGLLVLDEPFAALDYERTLSLRQFISDVAKKLELTVLFISHDLDEALMLGDQVVFLSRMPTRVVESLQVDLPYPRTLETTSTPAFLSLRETAINVFRRCTSE